jgi:decaprenylphospho-beta-D-erythro-pentofuranosid-2-ulose 2-reductase
MRKTVILVGVTSALGKALVREFAVNNYDLVCCSRQKRQGRIIAQDAALRFGVKTSYYQYDAKKLKTHGQLLHKIKSEHHNVVGLIIIHGYLDENDGLHLTLEGLRTLISINFESIVTFTKTFANMFNKEGNFVAVVSSIAGDRGKERNLVYNAVKRATSTYLQGFRQAAKGIHVLDVKPGFIDTPMTWGSVDSRLIASREKVAKDIVQAIHARKRVLYTPFFWKYIMLLIKHIPGPIYDRLKL